MLFHNNLLVSLVLATFLFFSIDSFAQSQPSHGPRHDPRLDLVPTPPPEVAPAPPQEIIEPQGWWWLIGVGLGAGFMLLYRSSGCMGGPDDFYFAGNVPAWGGWDGFAKEMRARGWSSYKYFGECYNV